MSSQQARQPPISGADDDLFSRTKTANRTGTELKDMVRMFNKTANRTGTELKDMVRMFNKTDVRSTRIIYATRNSVKRFETPEDLVQDRKRDDVSGVNGICVIENASPAILQILEAEWDLDPSFVANYFSNPAPDQFWHYGSSSSWMVSRDDSTPPRFIGSHHLHGVFEYHGCELKAVDQRGAYVERHCFQDAHKNFPVQSNTKISYCLIRRGFYLFLVDPPSKIWQTFSATIPTSSKQLHAGLTPTPVGHLYTMPRVHPTLRFMCSLNRGGLRFNQLLDTDTFSLFDLFERFLRHGWHFDLIFTEPDKFFPGPPLLYTLSNFINEFNLRFLTKSIREISFRELRSPSAAINNLLHDRREDLATLKDTLNQTNLNMPPTVGEFFKNHAYYTDPNSIAFGRSYDPVVMHQLMPKDILELEKFLMDSFTLLMSSLSVQDSQRTLAQAEQGIRQSKISTLLALLATIFLPANLVTGIFGMNLQELNHSGVQVWVCVVTMFVIGTLMSVPLLLVNRVSRTL